jgi:hydrogenase/urease accessory protein HupE
MRFWLLALLWLVIGSARAHDPKYSSLTVRTDGQHLAVSAIVPLSRISTAEGAGAVVSRTVVWVDGIPVPLIASAPAAVDTVAQTMLVDMTATLTNPATTLAIPQRLFPQDSGSRTMVAVHRAERLVREDILSADRPSLSVGLEEPSEGPLSVVRRFIREGIYHIGIGPDHILFIVGLVLLGGTLRRLLTIATAFTAAHSLTLALTAFGIFAPSPRLVEPLIALSIVCIGVDNLLSKSGEHDIRSWLAFGFGLIHGFGFAGALSDLHLPTASLGWAIAAFNIGVECGQALIILLLAPALAVLQRRSLIARRRITVIGSIGIVLMGAYWFVERILT